MLPNHSDHQSTASFFQFRRNSYLFSLLLIFSIGISLGIASTLFIKTVTDSSLTRVSFVEKRQSGYTFINPLLECEYFNDKDIVLTKNISKEVKKSVELFTSQPELLNISVYYKNLNSGYSFEINSDEIYSPASLFKVPLMIAILKEAQTNPLLMQTSIYYDPNMSSEDQSIQYFKPDHLMEPNQEYTVEELLNNMIIYSDNTASNLLSQVVSEEKIIAVEDDLGLILIPDEEGMLSVSVKNYAGLFRILYNSSYLEPSLSEKALNILSQSSFVQGLPAKLPDNILVAHKFGERKFGDSFSNAMNDYSERQLHDCGIVYYSRAPYLLCIMTRGRDYERMLDSIQKLSLLTFQHHQKLVDQTN